MKGSFREQQAADRQLRGDYIERSLDVVYEELDDPAVIQSIGSGVTKLSSIANNAFATRTVKGVIQLPEELPDDAGLAVVAVRTHEYAIRLSRDYWTQTDYQRHRTLNILESWEPRDSAESFYDNHVSRDMSQQYIIDDLEFFGAHVTTLAQTGVFSERTLDDHFYSPPSNSLAIVKYRPAMILFMESDTEHANADSIAHHLVHARQIEDQPLSTFESQSSFDIPAMREELEAYQVGRTLAERRLQFFGAMAMESDLNSESLLQIFVDNIRRESNTDPSDPYRPSAELTAVLSDLIDENVSHTKFDFSRTLDHIRRREDETDW
jgi:hypothetical protein